MRKSAQLVLQALADSHALTQRQLVERTGLSKRSVKYALKSLVSGGTASVRCNARDMRRKIYTANGVRRDARGAGNANHKHDGSPADSTTERLKSFYSETAK